MSIDVTVVLTAGFHLSDVDVQGLPEMDAIDYLDSDMLLVHDSGEFGFLGVELGGISADREGITISDVPPANYRTLGDMAVARTTLLERLQARKDEANRKHAQGELNCSDEARGVGQAWFDWAIEQAATRPIVLVLASVVS
jgi:hypothetical protein